MGPLIEQVLDEIRGAWRFRWLAVGVAAAAAFVGWLIVFALPDRYEATATVFVDTRTALKPVLQNLTIDQDVNAQLNYVRESLLAGPQLLEIAKETGVIPASGIDPREQDYLLDDMQKRVDISVRSAGATANSEERNTGTIYDIAYRDTDRSRGLRVVQRLLDALVNETLGGKRAGSEHAQQFLGTQIKDYEQRLRDAENRLAAFKAQHIGLLPTEQGGYSAELQKQMDAIDDVKGKLAIARSRKAALERELHGDVAVEAAGTIAPATGPGGIVAGADIATQIAQTQARLDELLLKFTDKYPDVIAAREQLKELKRRQAEEIARLRQGDPAAIAATRAGSNPVFQNVQLALTQANTDIADLTTELGQHEAKAAELRRLLDTAQQVEAQYNQLNRDYDVNKAQYTALLQSYEKARLGERADDAGSVRFEIVQPPSADFVPVSPRRTLSLAGVLLAAIAAGGGLAYGLHRLNPVVTSPAGLAELTGAAVLGTVGVAFPELEARKARQDRLRLSLAAAALLASFVVAVILSVSGYRLTP